MIAEPLLSAMEVTSYCVTVRPGTSTASVWAISSAVAESQRTWSQP